MRDAARGREEKEEEEEEEDDGSQHRYDFPCDLFNVYVFPFVFLLYVFCWDRRHLQKTVSNLGRPLIYRGRPKLDRNFWNSSFFLFLKRIIKT